MPITINGSGSILGVSTLTQLSSLDVGGNVSVGGTLTYEDVSNIDAIGVVTARSGVHFGTAASGTLVVGDSNGIGIGTNNPQKLLDIFEDDATDTVVQIRSGTGNREKSRITKINQTTGNGDLQIQSSSGANGHSIVFLTDNSGEERMHINGGGNIGIGNTLPLYAMHFKNEMSSTPSYIHMEVTGTNTVGGGGGIAFDTSASNNASNNSLYLATIRGERTSDDNGSNNLVFSTSLSGAVGDDGNTHTPSERLRIGARGELGLSGANYGAVGQVIKSNGSDASPAWSDLYSRYFYGEQDTSQTGLSNATWTRIRHLGTRAINIGPSSIATWDENNGTLTIGADGAGYWYLSMGGGVDDIQSADYIQVAIGRNGGTTSLGDRISSYSRTHSSAANHVVDAQVSTIVELSANDVVRFYLYHNEGTNDEATEQNRCFAMGYKI